MTAANAALLYDNSQAGRLRAAGADALDLLNRLSTNRVDRLQPGQGAPTILTTDRGRILDLLLAVNAGPYALLLAGPGSPPEIIAWLDKYTIMEDLSVADLTADTAQFTLIGAAAADLIAAAGLADRRQLDALPPYAAITGSETMLIRRPLAALPAWELIVLDKAAAPEIRRQLTAAGFAPIGQNDWDALMVSQGIPRSGRELTDAYNPLEAGLIGAIDFAKGCYIGQEVIARLDTYQKVQKHLALLRLSPDSQAANGVDRNAAANAAAELTAAANAGAELTAAGRKAGAELTAAGRNAGAELTAAGRNAGTELTAAGSKAGQITSVAAHPDTGELLALAYIRAANAQPGTQLTLSAPPQGSAEIISIPQLFGPGE